MNCFCFVLFFNLTVCIAGVFGNCDCVLGQNCICTLHSLLRLSRQRWKVRLDSWLRTEQLKSDEMHVSSKRDSGWFLVWFTKFCPRSILHSDSKAKEPITLTYSMDVVAHRALSPLSAAGSAAPTAEGTFTQALVRPTGLALRSSSTPTIPASNLLLLCINS